MINKGFFFFALVSVLLSCKHDSLIEIKATEIDCSTGEVAFVNKIQPIFDANCATASCHNTTDARDGVNLATYSSVIETGGVVVKDAANSELYEVLNETGSKMMPPANSGFSLSNMQKEDIKNWINSGAKNSVCDSIISPSLQCDSLMISFKDDIMPLLAESCVSCHKGSTANGSVWLDNYTDVKIWADNGALLGSIKHEANYSNMPDGLPKWNDCKIAKLANWIKEGALNN
ncbi:MAG: c-type cytochrome [Chitinophagales bacterium]